MARKQTTPPTPAPTPAADPSPEAREARIVQRAYELMEKASNTRRQTIADLRAKGTAFEHPPALPGWDAFLAEATQLIASETESPATTPAPAAPTPATQPATE